MHEFVPLFDGVSLAGWHPAHWFDAMFGETRWGKGAQCRWRNIRIKEL
jgi:hypothetical protein